MLLLQAWCLAVPHLTNSSQWNAGLGGCSARVCKRPRETRITRPPTLEMRKERLSQVKSPAQRHPARK